MLIEQTKAISPEKFTVFLAYKVFEFENCWQKEDKFVKT